MSRRAQTLLLLVLAALFAAGLATLYRLRLGSGDVYPPYSSFRADPLGTRVLFESLDRLPDVRAQRWRRPVEKLPRPLPATLVFAGVSARAWQRVDADSLRRLDLLARGGARVVVTFAAEFEHQYFARGGGPAKPAGKNRKTSPKDDKPQDAPGDETAEPGEDEATETQAPPPDWGAQVVVKWLAREKSGGAARAEGAPAELPPVVAWKSDLSFELARDAGWRVLYQRDGKPVLIERALGAGSLVFAADSFFLSNEALLRERATPLLAWLAGGAGVVVFDEHHLGLVEETGLAALARRYGLGGAMLVALLLVALLVWRRMALFVPPSAASPVAFADYAPTAGLEALLRRSVPDAGLFETCLAEWRRTAAPADLARVEKALKENPPGPKHPAAAYNAARNALKKR
jgi:hypothetical protein